MEMEEFQALKNGLQQLNVELKRFKEELLTTRAEELEQIGHTQARSPYLRMPEIAKKLNKKEIPRRLGVPWKNTQVKSIPYPQEVKDGKRKFRGLD